MYVCILSIRFHLIIFFKPIEGVTCWVLSPVANFVCLFM